MDSPTSLSADHARTGLTGTSFVSEEPSSAFQTPMSSCRSEPMLTGRRLIRCLRLRGGSFGSAITRSILDVLIDAPAGCSPCDPRPPDYLGNR